MITYEEYRKIRDLKNMKDSDVAKRGGFYQSILSDWKKGVSYPKADKMQKIADALEVSYFEFINDMNTDVFQKELLVTQWNFNDDELQLIRKSRRLNETGFDKLCNYLDDLLEMDKYLN